MSLLRQWVLPWRVPGPRHWKAPVLFGFFFFFFPRKCCNRWLAHLYFKFYSPIISGFSGRRLSASVYKNNQHGPERVAQPSRAPGAPWGGAPTRPGIGGRLGRGQPRNVLPASSPAWARREARPRPGSARRSRAEGRAGRGGGRGAVGRRLPKGLGVGLSGARPETVRFPNTLLPGGSLTEGRP